MFSPAKSDAVADLTAEMVTFLVIIVVMVLEFTGGAPCSKGVAVALLANDVTVVDEGT
ncbi:hypothetical protein D3C85_1236420 [compost metagenome]